MNKYKYLWNGEHRIGRPLVKPMWSNTCIAATCPKCGSGPGYYCETPKGRKAWPPHSERTAALPPEVTALSRITVYSPRRRDR